MNHHVKNIIKAKEYFDCHDKVSSAGLRDEYKQLMQRKKEAKDASLRCSGKGANMPVVYGKDTPKLGFGLMRLPKRGFAIDVEKVKTMVDLFLDSGFTYFDTAFVYPGSEAAINKALVDRYPRESYTLATK